MFTIISDTANYGVSIIQGAKKEWVKQFVKDDSMITTLNDFIDTQTTYTRQMIKTSADIGNAVSKELGKFPNFTSIK